MTVRESLPISPESPQKFADYTEVARVEPPKPDAQPARPDPAPPAHSQFGVDKNSWQKSKEAKELIESLQGRDSELTIVVDPDTHKVVVEVVDSRTGETIRKLPLRDAVQLAESLEELTGLLLDATE